MPEILDPTTDAPKTEEIYFFCFARKTHYTWTVLEQSIVRGDPGHLPIVPFWQIDALWATSGLRNSDRVSRSRWPMECPRIGAFPA